MKEGKKKQQHKTESDYDNTLSQTIKSSQIDFEKKNIN